MNELIVSMDKLITYAENKLGLTAKNSDYVRNGIMHTLGFSSPRTTFTVDGSIDELLAEFAACAVKIGGFDEAEADKLCDYVMGELSLNPDELQRLFYETERILGSKAATDMFYDYCVKNNYVKKSKLDRNPRFDSDGLIITINKAKPEFRDAKKAAAGNAVSGGYPLCSICHQNEGFVGRDKRTLRTVDITLGGQKWFWQYSPYGYFYQHGIAVNYEHTPMHIDRETFTRLIDFVDRFPHYFLGCNAALPRIGGSVLAHDHYQGGGEVLPLHRAGAVKTLTVDGGIIEILDWAGTVVRIVSKHREAVSEYSERVRKAWDCFDAPELGIIHADGDGVHNSISPTVLKTSRGYEMNIILRSNITSPQYPDGVFHAHPEFHVIKKESIGLIEAQGLFILPGRLEGELDTLCKCIRDGKALPKELQDYQQVFDEIKNICGDTRDTVGIQNAVRKELGSVCKRILQNTAVFKTHDLTEKFLRERALKNG